MATTRTIIQYTNFDDLLNVGSSDFMLANSELTSCKNCYIYKLGRLEKVPGYTKAGTTELNSGEDIVFLHYYKNSASLTDYMIGGAEGSNGELQLKYRTSGDWATISGYNGQYDNEDELDAENYLDKMFIVGAETPYAIGNFEDPATISGTTWTNSASTDPDLDDMPAGKYIVRYRDLLYVLNTNIFTTNYPSRAYYCNDPVDGAITWDLDSNFISFGHDDGDEITGAAEVFDRLAVFKQFSMWQYDETRIEKVADIGCDSHRTIKKVEGNLYWYNNNGIYMWSGGLPVLISNKVQEYIDAIDQSTRKTLFAVQDSFEYKLYIGTVTVNEATYSNAWICYDVRRGTFYIRATVKEAFSAVKYIEDDKERAYFGGDGYAYKFARRVDAIYSDDGEEIDSFFVTKALDHGAPEDTKHTNHMTVFSRYAESLKCAVDINKNRSFDNVNVTRFDKNIGYADILSAGNRYQYKFYEKSSNKSWEFEGFTIATEILEHEE